MNVAAFEEKVGLVVRETVVLAKQARKKTQLDNENKEANGKYERAEDKKKSKPDADRIRGKHIASNSTVVLALAPASQA
eukprot:CAMPEP_0172923210 /NCGR_PEP_ID=MMETSP1075-20121228/209299_1 /TAXON_ID=2916 /ORGANISM="Ceratium fusus, Strain PA161109" /LENGTH=78 /DNA_ID=CAMNT_0013783651 /DNA_START=317 /DNA_END=550 /DNA_ORIENTATION=+